MGGLQGQDKDGNWFDLTPEPDSFMLMVAQFIQFYSNEKYKALSMEASRLATVGECKSRLEEASRKREETNAAFISATRAALEDKLDATSSNREAYLYGLHAKITDYEEYAQKVHLGHEDAIRKLEERIQSKLVLASANRDTELTKKLETLRKHSSKISEVQELVNKKMETMKLQLEQEVAAKDERLRKISEEVFKRQESVKSNLEKLEQAQENRNKEEEELKRKTNEKMKQKLQSAHQNKMELMADKNKKKEENDRRAEFVRANKERLMAEVKNDIASSG
ncbi:hypothetical protein Pcinc_006606 [Petrolisthes cinctipes]|uniref:Uncharacterized protein n=1 Tax=Petrolisthes cinctipes TaxID=88211 RepID=A0AAE1GA75_PETCI|nr:hypothetical protein Pcinc_006606 [Petrolisthes cinctipes]